MSDEIIRSIPGPDRNSRQTDFPTIAFRSVVPDLGKDCAETAVENISGRISAKRRLSTANTITEMRSLARSDTRTAMIMRCKDATAAARVSAATALLDRGGGKAAQPFGRSADGPIEFIHRIEWKADFQHLRRWRRSVEQAQSYTSKAVITIIATGFVAAVWLGVKATLGK